MCEAWRLKPLLAAVFLLFISALGSAYRHPEGAYLGKGIWVTWVTSMASFNSPGYLEKFCRKAKAALSGGLMLLFKKRW